jgi:iron-sulfur cluster repair protein YtfE (RIC family)
MNNVIDILTKLVAYHEDAQKYGVVLANLSKTLKENSFLLFKKKIEVFHEAIIADHFRFEELIVFPAIQSVKNHFKIQKAIIMFLDQHKKIADSTKNLMSFQLDKIEPEQLKMVQENLLYLSRQMLEHIKAENDILMPLINSNRSIRFLMGKAFITYKSKYKKLYSDKSN